MSLTSVIALPINPRLLDDAALAHRLVALLADEDSSPRALCDALWAACFRRLNAAGTDDPLTTAERVCLDALAFQGQVNNGGV